MALLDLNSLQQVETFKKSYVWNYVYKYLDTRDNSSNIVLNYYNNVKGTVDYDSKAEHYEVSLGIKGVTPQSELKMFNFIRGSFILVNNTRGEFGKIYTTYIWLDEIGKPILSVDREVVERIYNSIGKEQAIQQYCLDYMKVLN